MSLSLPGGLCSTPQKLLAISTFHIHPLNSKTGIIADKHVGNKQVVSKPMKNGGKTHGAPGRK